MIYLIIGYVALLMYAATLYGADKRMIAQNERLFAMIAELEADKRALTESLTRSQGKTYISTTTGNHLAPSSGWFDAQDIVAPKKREEN